MVGTVRKAVGKVTDTSTDVFTDAGPVNGVEPVWIVEPAPPVTSDRAVSTEFARLAK
jgi:hypothetical protein